MNKQTSVIMKKYSLFTLFCLLNLTAFTQNQITQTIRGTVLDAQSKYPIIGATIQLIKDGEAVGTSTDVDVKFSLSDYRKLSKNTGFTTLIEEDITRNTLPTYSLVRKLQNKEDKIINFAEKVSRWEIIRYLILSYTNGE